MESEDNGNEEQEQEQEQEQSQTIIDGKYLKIKRLGSGSEGVAYKVKEIKTGKKYVAKIMEFEETYDEDEIKENEKILQIKKKIFYKISNIKPPSPYIIGCIYAGKGNIIKNDNIKNRNYFIFEYAKRGDLWKITQIGGGLGERCSKIIFKRILLGVQALHKAGIYHRDLKVDNIVLDKEYNPKICDFGLATDEKGVLNDGIGTINYKPPQKFEGKDYNGIKADIFSLGCVLFALVARGPWFSSAERDDELYKFIINKDTNAYFKKLKTTVEGVEYLTPEFKKLYTTMISYEEEDRIDIDDIIKDEWFNEINNLSEEKQNEEIKQKLKEKEAKVKEFLEDNPEILNQFETFPSSSIRSLENDIKIYFLEDVKIKNKKIELDGYNYVKIKGKLNYNNYMNTLLNKIYDKYNDEDKDDIKEECNIKEDSETYKCDITFEPIDGEEENTNKKKCIIQLKLFKTGEEEYILRFLRKAGDLPEYYTKVIEFISIAKKLL